MSAGAIGYLLRRSLRNRVRAQLTRLRRPRYALALALAVGYVALIFYRPQTTNGDVLPPTLGAATAGVQHALALGSAFALALLTAKWWLFSAAPGTLAFTPAEVQFLFPAPIRRRDLILYRVLRVQFSMLISATFVALLFWRSGSSLPVVLRIIGLWALFSTTFLHQMGVTLVHTAAAHRGRGLWRNAPAIAIVAAGTIVLAYAVISALGPVSTPAELLDGMSRLGPALARPLPAAVLLPFRWILAPAYARTSADWLRAIGPAALLLALHYVWILRADATFEEAAADASARRAARLAARSLSATQGVQTPARRQARLRVPLAAVGPAWIAIVWKNTLGFARTARLLATLRLATIVVVALGVIHAGGFTGGSGATPALVVGVGAGIGVIYLAIAGPLSVRNDLRADLVHLAVLRTYPMRGRTILFAEIVSSAFTLTAMQIALLLIAGALVTRVPLDERASLLAGAAVILPAINLVSFTIQNAIAVLVPGWVRLGAMTADAGQVGFEMFGQRALVAVASILALALALAPPAVVGVLVTTLLGHSTPAITGAVTAGLAVAAGEVWLSIGWLGGVLDRTDAVSVRA